MTLPSASVIVPTYRGAARLPRLLASLRTQQHPDWELIVVIDGDVDGSEQVVRAAAEGLPLRLEVLPANRGRAAALNAGHAVARGEVLIRCDDDLHVSPHHVERHTRHHAEASHALGAIGMCRNVYADTAYARAYGRPADDRLRADAYRTPADELWRFWGANVSVTRETWDRVGEYDEQFTGYGWEDVDFGYRLWRAGVGLGCFADLEVTHDVAATTTRDRVQRARASGSARVRFEAKHPEAAPRLGSTDRPRNPWSVAVAATARLGPERVAGLVDGVLPLLPRLVAEKAVAVAVEAAARAGHRSPRRGAS